MIDVEDVLRDELDRLVRVAAKPDWDAVVAGSGIRREQMCRRAVAGAGLALLAAVLALGTPLGSALARGLSDFSAWINGQPGSPASNSQQRAFERANAHSWIGFPKDTQLRQLITEQAGKARVELLGFRSGTSAFCLRVVVHGVGQSTMQGCASLDDLRLGGSPVRVVIVDRPVGKGDKVAWFGVDRVHSAHLQITAGIADDSVRSLTLHDNQGDHEVRAHSNAFLYVAQIPDVGQRVRRISARTTTGVVDVPFAPSPFEMGAGGSIAVAAPTVQVQRPVHGGRIAWLEDREPRGQPFAALPQRLRKALLGSSVGLHHRTTVVFGRVLTPDPNLPLRVAVSLNAERKGTAATGICVTVITTSGAGGGCSPYPAVFDQRPVTVGSFGNGPDEYITADGVASDDVRRLAAVLANGKRVSVALADNTFLVNLPRAMLPARLVAFDQNGKTIGVSDPIQDFIAGGTAAPARGRAKQLLSVHGPHGVHAEILVGGSTTGGTCMYFRHHISAQEAGLMISCTGRRWTGSALQLSADSTPPRFVAGRVRPDISTVRLRYSDGTTETLSPKHGLIVEAMTAAHLTRGHELVEADAIAPSGKTVAHQSFRPPKPAGSG